MGAKEGVCISYPPRALLSNPKTSDGLIVSRDPAALGEVLAIFRGHGFEAAAAVGEVADMPVVQRQADPTMM